MMRRVSPLGVFGCIASQSRFALRAADLEALGGEIALAERTVIGSYLRNCPVIIALMGYSEDVLGDEFLVTGGTAILSDGVFFWRRDAAEYVETYGTGLPEDFLLRGRKEGWQVPILSRDELIDIDDYFMWLRTQER